MSAKKTSVANTIMAPTLPGKNVGDNSRAGELLRTSPSPLWDLPEAPQDPDLCRYLTSKAKPAHYLRPAPPLPPHIVYFGVVQLWCGIQPSAADCRPWATSCVGYTLHRFPETPVCSSPPAQAAASPWWRITALQCWTSARSCCNHEVSV